MVARAKQWRVEELSDLSREGRPQPSWDEVSRTTMFWLLMWQSGFVLRPLHPLLYRTGAVPSLGYPWFIIQQREKSQLVLSPLLDFRRRVSKRMRGVLLAPLTSDTVGKADTEGIWPPRPCCSNPQMQAGSRERMACWTHHQIKINVMGSPVWVKLTARATAGLQALGQRQQRQVKYNRST